jgi:hypothetical protein
MNATNLEGAADMGGASTQRPASDDTMGNSRSIHLKVATFINAHKILVIPVVLRLMWFYDNWSIDAGQRQVYVPAPGLC